MTLEQLAVRCQELLDEGVPPDQPVNLYVHDGPVEGGTGWWYDLYAQEVVWEWDDTGRVRYLRIVGEA